MGAGPSGPSDVFFAGDMSFGDQATLEAQIKAKKQDAVKGFSYYILYTILLAGNNYAQLALFKYAPTISTIQLTFIRGLMCALVVLCMLTMRG